MNGIVLLTSLTPESDFTVKTITVKRLPSKALKHCFFVIVLFVDSRDDGLFAVAVVTAVLLSLILGFVLGLTFHGQVVKRCVRSSRDPESCDGPNKTVEGVKYTKSPPRDENFTRNKNETRSKRKLLKKKGKNVQETEDTDSDSSTAGKIGQEQGGNQKDSSTSSSPSKSISSSVVIAKFAKKKPSPKNGKIPNVC